MNKVGYYPRVRWKFISQFLSKAICLKTLVDGFLVHFFFFNSLTPTKVTLRYIWLFLLATVNTQCRALAWFPFMALYSCTQCQRHTRRSHSSTSSCWLLYSTRARISFLWKIFQQCLVNADNHSFWYKIGLLAEWIR